MNSVLDVACFIQQEYFMRYNNFIDEMKLHKLLYFANRESFAIWGRPLFIEKQQAWVLGPISLEVRHAYNQKSYLKKDYLEMDEFSKMIVLRIMDEYASLSSLKLSKLTHFESSWLKAREGIETHEKSKNYLADNDILNDAYLKHKRYKHKSLK